MYFIASLYPEIDKKSGLTAIYLHTYSHDALAESASYKKMINDVLERHCPTYEFEETDERFTLVTTYSEIFAVQHPIIIPHEKPERYTCSKTYRRMTKKEIWAQTLIDVAEMIQYSDKNDESEDEV